MDRFSTTTIASSLMRLSLIGACAIALSACVTAKEQQAMDRNQCAGFGFEPGTDGFALCMMGVVQQREVLEENRRMQRQAQLAEENRQREQQQEVYKILSQQRSGDKRFPVCGASSSGGMDRRTMTWYGPGCRAR
ncbi:hypothetical protein FHR71_004005 [Methylobacterium sp. RAS18]|nr:hypothetical protein [Methylobacterium sp. RAS18]